MLVGLVHIADVPFGWESSVDTTIRSFDGNLNDAGVTCKTWLFRVLDLLREEERGYAVLRCDDLVALEREITDWGNRYALDADKNVQPRPVGESTICNLYGSRRSSVVSESNPYEERLLADIRSGPIMEVGEVLW